MNQTINDKFIIDYFFLKSNPNKIDCWKIRDIPNDIQEYLYSRYNDANDSSLKEIIQRIRFGIEERPKCKICNKNYTSYIRLGIYKATCCKECENIYRQIRTKEAVFRKYGVDNVSKIQEIKDKKKQTFNNNYPINSDKRKELLDNEAKNFKETCMKKYGCHPMQVKEIKQKSIENLKISMQEKYGVNCYYQTDEFKRKLKEYSLSTYGTEHITQAEVNRQKNSKGMIEHGVNKMKETCKKRYGCESWTQSKEGHDKLSSFEVQKKQHDTRKKLKIYSKSKVEDKVYDILKQHFPDTIHNYFSQEYPFNCDYYIPSLDLYIEFQGTWQHGGHPFNKLNENDLQIVKMWKQKANEISFNGKPKISYNNAINVWTDRDVLKRNIAKQHNLNYKELWSIEEAKQYVKTIIQ